MSNNSLKEQRIKLESQIITMVFNDNRNTVHFDYHVNIDSARENIRLDLYTKNARHDAIFLMHQTRGDSSIDALNRMITYLKDHHQAREKNSYTVYWRSKVDANSAEKSSYFFEYSEAEVRRKFFYNKKEEDFDIRIVQNPMA